VQISCTNASCVFECMCIPVCVVVCSANVNQPCDGGATCCQDLACGGSNTCECCNLLSAPVIMATRGFASPGTYDTICCVAHTTPTAACSWCLTYANPSCIVSCLTCSVSCCQQRAHCHRPSTLNMLAELIYNLRVLVRVLLNTPALLGVISLQISQAIITYAMHDAIVLGAMLVLIHVLRVSCSSCMCRLLSHWRLIHGYKWPATTLLRR